MVCFQASLAFIGGQERSENAGALGYFAGAVYAGAVGNSRNVAEQREMVNNVLGSVLTVEAVSAVELVEAGEADAGAVLTPLVAAVGGAFREETPLDARVGAVLGLLVDFGR